MSPTWTTFLFEAVNFLILASVLGWLLFRPVRQAIENRRATLAKETEAAAAKRAEAGRLQEEIRQRTVALEAELDRVRQATLATAQQDAERILVEARAAAEQERQAIHRRLTHLEDTQRERLAAAVATATGTVVEHLLRQIGGPDLHRGLVQAACRELQTLEGKALGSVVVESAHPLDEGTRAQLIAMLGEAARGTEFRLTPTLGVGIRISTSRGLVDASAAGLAAFARRELAIQLGAPLNGRTGANSPTPKNAPNHA